MGWVELRCEVDVMEGWRHGGMEGWRDGGMERWRDGWNGCDVTMDER